MRNGVTSSEKGKPTIETTGERSGRTAIQKAG